MITKMSQFKDFPNFGWGGSDLKISDFSETEIKINIVLGGGDKYHVLILHVVFWMASSNVSLLSQLMQRIFQIIWQRGGEHLSPPPKIPFLIGFANSVFKGA